MIFDGDYAEPSFNYPQATLGSLAPWLGGMELLPSCRVLTVQRRRVRFLLKSLSISESISDLSITDSPAVTAVQNDATGRRSANYEVKFTGETRLIYETVSLVDLRSIYGRESRDGGRKHAVHQVNRYSCPGSSVDN